MTKLTRRDTLALAATAGAATLLPRTVTATETLNMVAIDGYPERAMWIQEFSNFFIPEVDRRLAESGSYAIEWQEAYGGAIVRPRGVLEGIELGLGDIGIVTTIFHSSALPSQAISAVTPMICSDARIVARAVDEIARELPTMDEEFGALNQVYLATGVVLDSYQVFSREPVASLADLEGQKMGRRRLQSALSGGDFGAAGVRGGLTDFYNMLQTGVVDSAMLWPEAAATFSISEVAPHLLIANLGAVNSKTVTVNRDVWDGLPEEVREVLRAVAIDYRDQLANTAMERAASSVQAFIDSGGTVAEMSQEDRVAWAEAMPNIAVEWAHGLDEAGKPGSEMLVAYMSKLRDAGQVPARDWAAELDT